MDSNLVTQILTEVPSLSRADAIDLLSLAADDNDLGTDRLVKILTDYRRAKKLNKSQMTSLFKVIQKHLSGLSRIVTAIASII